MIKSIEEYLNELKRELKGSDPATVQDALADAEEHLRAALTSAPEKDPGAPEEDVLAQIIEQYGSPDETASAYREVERRTVPGLARGVSYRAPSALGRFLAVYDDPQAGGALLYMLISVVTGIVYFIWAVTGLSLSLSLAIFIFGLLFAVFFIVSLRGLGPPGRADRRGIIGRTHAAAVTFFSDGDELVRPSQGQPDR